MEQDIIDDERRSTDSVCRTRDFIGMAINWAVQNTVHQDWQERAV